MLIIPAIDLKEGRCVRLQRGIMSTATIYSDDPAFTAKRWEAEGAQWLHVVDLDGAFAKKPKNLTAIASIVDSVEIPIQVGGGVRTLETLATYLDIGVERVVMGTAAHSNPEILVQACQRFPGKVVLGIDSRKGKVAIEGWSQTTDMGSGDLATRFESLDLAAIVYTDISRDGMESGPNVEATRQLALAVKTPVIASGGVGNLDHIRALLPLEQDGVVGVIVGRALYSGSLVLSEAIALTKRV
ncbi:MAG: 1-(5-phosphoribosyl)-5-[(5-phosphoribosylamino)methylideneamino]imidazole-4-carboxamide isomerase [Deltaproteobacteria bacterium]|nr:1-(5-phosphoribosyl)-5-[(5-phosphoribosylamino)methylideneamino]imidazole-4-carboxamide isomerase [Deltaproteobacteria bacterium]